MTDLPRHVIVRAVDLRGQLIPGARILYWINDEPDPLVAEGYGQATIDLPGPLATATLRVAAEFEEEKLGPQTLDNDQPEWTFTFQRDIHPLWREFPMKHFPALVGIAFILLAVVLVFTFPSPTALQTHIILAMFALGGGGFGGEIAGFIKTDLTLGSKLKIAAGGAAAIFVVLYFFVPAGTT